MTDYRLRVVCSDPCAFHTRHGLSVVKDFARTDNGTIWLDDVRATARENRRMDAAREGERNVRPAAFYSPSLDPSGFYWLRDGVRVTGSDAAGLHMIFTARLSRGPRPAAEILDGVTRHLDLACRCGQRLSCDGDTGSMALDALAATDAAQVELGTLRRIVAKVRHAETG